MKFILFVEGDVERYVLPDFLKRWLDPKLDQRVGIIAVNFGGCGAYLAQFVKRAVAIMQSSKRDETIAIIGLLDLYGLPKNFFPPRCTRAKERYNQAKQKLEGLVSDKHFHQFFAVHELEAWLLSDPEILPPEVRKSLPGAVAKPESVNFNQPPAKLLDRLYRKKMKRNYQKTVDGNETQLPEDC